MIPKGYTLIGLLCLSVFLLVAGCGRVPPEVVELSYRTGQDLVEVQKSYDGLIHEFYNQLRQRREEYLESEWTPLYLQNWISDGKLVEVAKGEVVWSESDASFVRPSSGKERQQLLESISSWADEAIAHIGEKRSRLMAPLDVQEDSLRRDVNSALQQLIQANATITAHLNSLRKVQEIQDSALAALHIKDVRDRINHALVVVSDQASKELEIIREADKKVSTVTGK